MNENEYTPTEKTGDGETENADRPERDNTVDGADFAVLAAAASMNYLGNEQPQAVLLQLELAREMTVNEFEMTQKQERDKRFD